MAIHDEAKKTIRRLKEKLDKMKGSSCEDCHQEYPSYVLSFDLGVSEDLVVSTESSDARLLEIAEGALVCANCLRIRMHLRAKGTKIA